MQNKYFGKNHFYKAGLALVTFLSVLALAASSGETDLSNAQTRDSSYSTDQVYDDYDDGYDDHDEFGDHDDDFFADCEAVGDCDEGPDHDFYGTDPYNDDDHHIDGGNCHDAAGNSIPCDDDSEYVPVDPYYPGQIDCSNDYELVCGNDGGTYNNICWMEAAGTTLDHYGDCVDEMIENVDYCSEIGYVPVCGDDGANYENDCYANTNNIDIAYYGECEIDNQVFCTADYSPRCATDGTTYSNRCWLDEAGATLDYYGECEDTNESGTDLSAAEIAEMEGGLNLMGEALDQFIIMLDWFSDLGVDLSGIEQPFNEVLALLDEAWDYFYDEEYDALGQNMEELMMIFENEVMPQFEEIMTNSDLGEFFNNIEMEMETIEAKVAELEANNETIPNAYYEIQNLKNAVEEAFSNGDFETGLMLIEQVSDLISDFWNELGTDHTLSFEPPAGYEGEVITATSRNQFPDTDPSSLEGIAASYLYSRAIIGGFPDGEFKGDRTVNRAEAAKFLLLAADIEVKELLNKGRFWDVLEGQWYVKYVITAAEEGIIGGYSDGSFKPANPVNTAEFLKMISLAFDAELNLPHTYRDVPTDAWFAQYAGIAKEFNMFPNRSRELKPAQELTRREVAIAIYQLLIRQ